MTPDLFPEHRLPILKTETTGYSRDQADCLVPHQPWCNLRPPPWHKELFDFGIWYGSSQRHLKAVAMYLNALLRFFEQYGDLEGDVVELSVPYILHVFDRLAQLMPQDWQGCALSIANAIRAEAYSTKQQELHSQCAESAVVVSANKDIGFGQTATQEETLSGISRRLAQRSF
ncbi:Poly(ADP-ribose) glycohydrolase [Purpureocillium takamizusanense]|uniref:Poly(ADP-ribose) glycohydrolase n=1 Tax=Purpureocillium takamizusanense TaxID=2060973 RepID=A0A9Q8Q7F1_9HYPO|nr:Poly(ADP-ribose) glycohydrolase [Purpureocillium takamizusanense]UNI13753.1 Poly(ADP-ribose) glycohydrolase [Purpureocillium takamizusanense]